jgi:hypothetical protein
VGVGREREESKEGEGKDEEEEEGRKSTIDFPAVPRRHSVMRDTHAVHLGHTALDV